MPTPKPQYYIRMKVDDEWLFLFNVWYHPTRPIWLSETELDKRIPHLYKTLVGARAGLDHFVSARATQSEVAVWKGSDGQLQATGD